MRKRRTRLKNWSFTIFIKNREIPVFSWIARKPSTFISKIRVNLKSFLLVVREKSKKWKRCNFLDVYDVFGSEFCHFSNLTRKMKVIQLFKAKMEAFRDKKSKKVENDQNFLHLTFVLSVEMKTVF